VQIIYEDDDVFAAVKPAGVVMHADSHHPKGSFLEMVCTLRPTAQLLHRLDKDTSGVALFAKTDAAASYYKKLFKDTLIQKTYLALVVGTFTKKKGIIALPIGRSSSDPRKRSVGGKKGKLREARTDYSVLERFGDSFTLLEVFPKTGRTHQVRSHLASIGHPVACDALYGGKKYACPQGLKRQFLHAFGLSFTSRKGIRVKVEADLPEDLRYTLKELKKK